MADRNTRLVALLKVALPLGALIMLSTVFLLSRGIDPERAVARSPIDIAALVQEPRISQARFAGVTDDGAALTVMADITRADPEGAGLRLHLEGVAGTLETGGGRVTAFGAGAGVLDQAENLLRMEGAVRFRSDDGYALAMDVLTAALDRTALRGVGDVRGDAPAGTIRARELLLTETPSGSGRYVLVFSGGVKLVYTPEP